MIGEFTYSRPQTMEEALQSLSTEGSYPLAGGTDLLVQIRSGKLNPRVLVDLKGLAVLHEITGESDYIRIGPLATINRLLESSLLKPYAALMEGAGLLGCHEIRHRATVGGNLCNASPSGDVLMPLLLFDPVLVLQGPGGGKREIPMEQFYSGPGKTTLAGGELLTAILLPRPDRSKSLYRRKSRIKGMDLSSISMGLSMQVSPSGNYTFGIVFGAVTARPVRMRGAEKILSGKPLSSGLIAEAVQALQDAISPRAESLRGAPDYKRVMVGVMLADGILELTGGDGFE
jgi:CO/xanthine dehydrogenase FAD-binding subunit